MKFRVENLTWNNDGVFGEDMVTFDYDVVVEEPPDRFDYYMRLGQVLDHIQSTDPALDKYINEVRFSLDGWGPKEGKLVRELGDAVDFQKIIEERLAKDEYVSVIYNRIKQWREEAAKNPVQVKKTVEKTDELEKMQQAGHEDTKKHYDFCESIDNAVHDIAVRVYPEILDMTVAQLREFRFLFTSQILNMEKDLKALMNKKQ